MTTTEISQLYVSIFNRASEKAGNDNWAGNGKTAAENAALMLDTDAAKAYFGTSLDTDTAFVEHIYNTTLDKGGADVDATGKAGWVSLLESNVAAGMTATEARADMVVKMIAATAAYEVGGSKYDTADQATKDAAQQFVNRVAVSDYAAANIADVETGSTATYATTLAFGTGGLTVTAATADVDTAKTAVDTEATAQAALIADASAVEGTTYSLTTGVDTLTGTADNDTFTANLAVDVTSGIADIETISALDEIDGGAGTDVLNYYTVGGTALPAATITNVETINMKSDGAATMDVQNITGVTTLGAFATAGNVDIDTDGNVTTVNVTGTAEEVAITDNTTTEILTTVSITGAGNTAGNNTKVIDSTALTTLSLTNITGSENDDDADDITTDTTSALTLNLTNIAIAAADIIADTATSVTVNTLESSTTTVVFDDLSLDAATAVTINSAAATTIGSLDIGAVTSLVLTGAARTTLTAGTYTALTEFDASASTGGVTLTAALDDADNFIGGSGNDVIEVSETTKDITMGAGDDTVTITSGDTALGTSGSIDAGTGTDTLAMDAADIETASATVGATAFETTISNFEKVNVGLVGANTDITVNMAGLDDINYIVYNGTADDANIDTTTFNNVVSGGTIEILADAANSADDVTTINVAGAAVATDDVFNIHLNTGTANSDIVAEGAYTIANVETINISTLDNGSATGANIAASSHTLNLDATSATTINISGNSGLTLTNVGNTLVETMNASGIVDDGTLDTNADLAVVFVSDNITTAVTMTGGAGDDTLTADSATTFANTINGGAGDDAITGALGNDIIDTGAAGSATGDTVDAGAGADKITVGAGKQDITQADGDSGVFNIATVTTTGTESYDVIYGLSSGDVIDLATSIDTDTAHDTFTTAGAGAQLTATITAQTIGQFIGTYDAATNVFTSDATGDDLLLAYVNDDAATVADEAIILVGMTDVLTDAELTDGVITIA